MSLEQIIDPSRSRGAGDNVDVIQKSEQELSLLHLASHLLESVVDGQTEHERHEWVALFATLMLESSQV